MNQPSTHIALESLSKSYGGAYAVRDVFLEIERGTVHALVGENGAGKSSISKMIAGVTTPTSGTICVDGSVVSLTTPRKALAHGIAMIEQELTLVPEESVLSNVFLGVESGTGGFLREQRMRRRYAELAEQTGFDLSPDSVAGTLRVADQQKVEILRALARDARLLIMDEPTAALSVVESEQLYEVIRKLKSAGTTVIYISHFLDEVLALADTITVMRDGRHVHTRPASEETASSLVHAMLGRALEDTDQRAGVQVSTPPILEVESLTAPGRFSDITFEVRPGEVVGIAGLIGSGRTELLRAIAGEDRFESGSIRFAGKSVRWKSPRQAIAEGVILLPESRKEDGLIMEASIAENTVVSRLRTVSRWGFVRSRKEKSVVADFMHKLDIRTAVGAQSPVSSLSGGNQQKVVFAKCLMASPRVFLIDEPTRGVDVGAKRGIQSLINEFVAAGMGVVVVSSELDEVLALADRVLVMRRGRIAAEYPRETATRSAVLAAAFGTVDAA